MIGQRGYAWEMCIELRDGQSLRIRRIWSIRGGFARPKEEFKGLGIIKIVPHT